MREFQLLAELGADAVRAVLAQSRRRRFRAGETIFHDGDPGDTLHLVDKGRVAIRITTPSGDVAVVRVLRPGEHFGELAVLDPGPRTGSAIALDQVETLSLSRVSVDALRATDRSIDQALLTAMTAEVRRLAAALVDALFLPVERRVWRRLLDVTEAFATGAESVSLPITQEMLAQLAGTTRSSANKVLRPAEDQGMIAMRRGHIDVLDLDALRRRAR